METILLCPACGAPLPPDAPAGLCPLCLLKSDLPTQTGGEQSPPVASAPANGPVPGQMFGSYRINEQKENAAPRLHLEFVGTEWPL